MIVHVATYLSLMADDKASIDSRARKIGLMLSCSFGKVRDRKNVEFGNGELADYHLCARQECGEIVVQLYNSTMCPISGSGAVAIRRLCCNDLRVRCSEGSARVRAAAETDIFDTEPKVEEKTGLPR